ncbi:alpha/beta fold hydrolase [Paenibacillus sp. y28]|uniref:alpha/beta fold hydrolase n=1 Tax=Paenibacillus sp. y28 TaxID=3129110 RepID=UPI003018D8B9
MNEANRNPQQIRHASLDGFTMAYREYGQGLPVVLLHGFCGSSGYWEQVLPQLGENVRVIAPDLRGHGHSGTPEEPCSVEKMAGDIRSLLDQLGVDKAVLLGHSLGGYIALAFAEQYPERLLAFGLVHSTALPDDETGKQNRLKSMEAIRQDGIVPFVNNLTRKLFAPQHLDTMPEQVAAANEIGYVTSPQAAIHTLDAMRARPDRRHVLRETALPVLIVAGRHDQIVSVEKAFSVSGGHIKESILESAGHMGMMEAPQELAQVILDFTRTL